MAITVRQRTLAPDDPLLRLTSQPRAAVRTSLEGAAEDMVYLVGVCYALLEPSSPKQGVLIPMLRWGYILVAYCVNTRRTSVMATELTMLNDNATYTEQLSWLTAGQSAMVDFMFVYPSPLSLNFDPVISALRKAAAPLSVRLSFETHAAPSQSGLLEVLRATPACNVLHAPPSMLNPESVIAPGVAHLDGAAVLTTFNLIATIGSEDNLLPSWKRYDGQQGADRLPILSDAARSKLQWARETNLAEGRRTGRMRAVEDMRQISAKLMATGPTGDVTSDLLTYVNLQLAGVLAWGAYCPVCGSDARKLCGGCEAETYCSVEHQREDWPHHKGWFKQNRKSHASDK